MVAIVTIQESPGILLHFYNLGLGFPLFIDIFCTVIRCCSFLIICCEGLGVKFCVYIESFTSVVSFSFFSP